jgi:hypothetical protein
VTYGKGRKHHGMVTAVTGRFARGKKVLHNPTKKEVNQAWEKITRRR